MNVKTPYGCLALIFYQKCCKIFKVCLTILGRYAWEDLNYMSKMGLEFSNSGKSITEKCIIKSNIRFHNLLLLWSLDLISALSFFLNGFSDMQTFQLLSTLFSGSHRCKKNYKLSRIFCSLTFVKRHCFQRLTSCICHKSRKFTGKKIKKKMLTFCHGSNLSKNG